jgi:hypothetical protein
MTRFRPVAAFLLLSIAVSDSFAQREGAIKNFWLLPKFVAKLGGFREASGAKLLWPAATQSFFAKKPQPELDGFCQF